MLDGLLTRHLLPERDEHHLLDVIGHTRRLIAGRTTDRVADQASVVADESIEACVARGRVHVEVSGIVTAASAVGAPRPQNGTSPRVWRREGPSGVNEIGVRC